MLTREELKLLLEAATEAKENAFVLNTNSRGAAVMTENGEVFGGCNINGIISGTGICAERSAIDHAVIHGKYKFKALLVLSYKLDYPCGVCLQYLSMFSQVNDKDVEIFAVSQKGEIEHSSLFKLLPKRYLTATKIKEIKKYNK